ncbi:MAG: glycosyltransferase family 4 protein, partial [Acidobacteriota bacterium]
MRILFLSDNFPPESNAPARRVHEHASAWVDRGHQVTVITCAPHFPHGEVFPGYRNRWYTRETIDGIEVVRVRTYISANEGFWKRSLDYISFMFAGLLGGLVQARPDVIVGTTPQFFTAVGTWLLATARRRPFVLEVRDLWPASIIAVGALRPGRTARILERLELFLYRRATSIVAATESFKRDMVGRGIPADKICVVRAGADRGQFYPRAKDQELLRRLG